MAAVDVQNPPAPVESKSARKKKAKAAGRTESPATVAPTSERAASVSAFDVPEDGIDNAYIRELQKQIRNVTKKVNNASKTEAVVAEHKDKTLDELVEMRLINTDQKLQVKKKPELEKQLKQMEEQLEQHKKIEQEHRLQLAAQEKALTEKFEKEKADLIAELKEKAEADSAKMLSDSLLIVSQFLRLAAARRAEDVDASADENLALEGVLLLVYSGDETAVSTMLKLVNGSDEQTRSITNDVLETTYAQVKQAAVASSAPLLQAETSTQGSELDGVPEDTTEGAAEDSEEALVEGAAEGAAEGATDVVEPTQAPESDPTVANASLTEINEDSHLHLTNGNLEEPTTNGHLPVNMQVEDGAANAVGASQWDAGNEMSTSQEWVDVEVPREPAETETETGLDATPAAPSNTQSWADDQPDAPADVRAAAQEPSDGFHQVQRNRDRGGREGGYRGRGGDRGGYRGRGGFHRGDGRGRGRGRGGAGFRGGPRRGGDES